MHDPMTVAFEIRWPFPKLRDSAEAKMRDKKFRKRRFWFSGYLPPIVTVWHVDPEKDGTDDSCAWFWPRLTKDQMSRLRTMAQNEAGNPWFQRHEGKAIDDPVAATVLLDGAIDTVARMLRVRLSTDEAIRLRNRLLHDGFDNLRSSLAYRRGYHGNSDDDAYWREEHAIDLFACLARNILHGQRPWWRHPSWHVHHWKLQVHSVQNLKRFLWSRCEVCGERFSWGYAPISRNWGGNGPAWFKGEEGVKHHHCTNGTAPITVRR